MFIVSCIFLLVCLCIATAWLLWKWRCTQSSEVNTQQVPLTALRQTTIQTYLSQEAILPTLAHTQRDEVFKEMLLHLKSLGNLNDIHVALEALQHRELQMPTCIGNAIACPHARTAAVNKLTTIFAVSKTPILFDNSNNGACNIVILTLIPLTTNNPYMPFITALLSRLCSQKCREAILTSRTATDIRKALLS
jgi:mannitol/fructose-specific phosphotransferase system IIA component (Ntr-type)